MVNVVYDYQAFSLQERGGISRYIYELATPLANHDEFKIEILAFACMNKAPKNCNQNLVVNIPERMAYALNIHSALQNVLRNDYKHFVIWRTEKLRSV